MTSSSERKPFRPPWALVAVLWRDAFDGENGWTDMEKYEATETTVVTVGFLWPDCLPEYVTLVNSLMPDEADEPKTTSGPVHIPVGMVLETKVLDVVTFEYLGSGGVDGKSDGQALGCLRKPVKSRNVSSRLRGLLQLFSWSSVAKRFGRNANPDHTAVGSNPR
jgi:hypothetical protein